jgi:hypothetical protein
MGLMHPLVSHQRAHICRPSAGLPNAATDKRPHQAPGLHGPLARVFSSPEPRLGEALPSYSQHKGDEGKGAAQSAMQQVQKHTPLGDPCSEVLAEAEPAACMGGARAGQGRRRRLANTLTLALAPLTL